MPSGLLIAIYLSEYAPTGVRRVLKPVLEILAGVPTVVYGYFALLFVTPLLQKIYPELPGFNVLSAGIVMGIMIIPMVSSLSEDALSAVPRALRQGSPRPTHALKNWRWSSTRLTSATAVRRCEYQ